MTVIWWNIRNTHIAEFHKQRQRQSYSEVVSEDIVKNCELEGHQRWRASAFCFVFNYFLKLSENTENKLFRGRAWSQAKPKGRSWGKWVYNSVLFLLAYVNNLHSDFSFLVIQQGNTQTSMRLPNYIKYVFTIWMWTINN